MFFGLAKASLIQTDTLKFPIPDLVVEVLSPSTAVRDRGIKFQDYALHGVAEYWIVDSVAEAVEVYCLNGTTYAQVPLEPDGLLTSEVVAGFAVPVRAIFDEAVNAQVMRQIWSCAE
jgi:Uma2 family endonuclease